MNVIRDSLRTYLVDPRTTAGSTTTRTFIYTDEPLATTQYPRIQIKKIDNPSIPISIGYDYTEYEQLFLNIWFYSKNNFKITVSGVEYKNEQITEYYLGLIKSTLKAQASTLHDDGVKMYKHVNTTMVDYDPETQIYYGAVTIRVSYFNT